MICSETVAFFATTFGLLSPLKPTALYTLLVSKIGEIFHKMLAGDIVIALAFSKLNLKKIA